MMSKPDAHCVLLAEPHHATSECVRGLLMTTFEALVMVADEASLFESAGRMQIELAIVSTSLSTGNIVTLVRRIRVSFPALKLLALGPYDQPPLTRHILDAGANGFVLKHAPYTE